jgi:hypothetical protein
MTVRAVPNGVKPDDGNKRPTIMSEPPRLKPVAKPPDIASWLGLIGVGLLIMAAFMAHRVAGWCAVALMLLALAGRMDKKGG